MRLASCCMVEVVNGGGGLRRVGLASTDVTAKFAFSRSRVKASASAPEPMSSRWIFWPSAPTSRAWKVSSRGVARVALVRDVCTSLAKQFRAVALIHINQEPANLEALKRAAEEAKKAGASVCFTDLQKKRWVDRLGAAFSAGDHAGSFETSLMLACASASVREKERISVAPMDGLAGALKKGAKSFADAGGEDAYFGDPTAASVEEGEAHFTTLADILTLSIMEHLGSKA